MPVDLVAAAESRLRQLREQQERIAAETANLESWLATAKDLAAMAYDVYSTPTGSAGKSQTAPAEQPVAGDKIPETAKATANGKLIQVKRTAWVGLIARLILDNGPQTMGWLVPRLQEEGYGRGIAHRKLAVTINSALWRRKDLFKRGEGKVIDVTTRNIAFIEGDEASAKQPDDS